MEEGPTLNVAFTNSNRQILLVMPLMEFIDDKHNDFRIFFGWMHFNNSWWNDFPPLSYFIYHNVSMFVLSILPTPLSLLMLHATSVSFLNWKHYLKCCTIPFGISAIWLCECAISLWREQRCLLVPLCPNLSLPSTCSLPFPGQSASHYRCSIRQYLCTEQKSYWDFSAEYEAVGVVWLKVFTPD